MGVCPAVTTAAPAQILGVPLTQRTNAGIATWRPRHTAANLCHNHSNRRTHLVTNQVRKTAVGAGRSGEE